MIILKKIVLVIILLLIVLGAAFLFLNNAKTNQAPVQVQTNQQTNQQVEVSQNSVSIKDFAFNPSVLNVKQGETVTWTNEDSATHRIKSDKFNSQDLNQGDKFEFTFKDKGTFDYTCGIHPSMKGEIVVK